MIVLDRKEEFVAAMPATDALSHAFSDMNTGVEVQDMEDDGGINLLGNPPASTAESEEEFGSVSELYMSNNNLYSSASSTSSSRASKSRNGCKAREEKIFVSVRVRPINDREMARHDFPVWECNRTGQNTISFTSSNEKERPVLPQSYVFDHVFGAEISCKEVYEKGAKDVALSALKGKNATIFAYGQTSSGKTYTMQGIAKNATDDIFTYINQNDDRVFLLKISAIEIYNETTTDLLNPESGPLRVLDDPEKGTVIEKLEEIIVKDKDHLQSLLAICEAHRQIGETSLNDYSSRSHQIIRLSIESSLRVVTDDGPVKSLIAMLNFVDLAGSERASFPHSEGTRLKEGCYINRSLLTLSTVIRKLSESNRVKACHVPYRDSKLTRILQNSLGGNARTAIICTMSGSNRHVEQTRNTLFFASCAKEVTNRAQVNMVISDKELIKQLKREVALLEAKLRTSRFSSRNSSDSLIVEKDLQIQRMQDEMDKALQQRDLAESRLDGFLKKMEASAQSRALTLSKINVVDLPPLRQSFDDQNFPTPSSNGSMEQDDGPWVKLMKSSPSERLLIKYREKQSTSASTVLLQEIYRLEQLQNALAQDANQALQAVQKEIECLRLAQSGMNEKTIESITKLQAEIREIYESPVTGCLGKDHYITKDLTVEKCAASTSLKDEIQKIVTKQKEKSGEEKLRESEAHFVDLDHRRVNLHGPVDELGGPKLKEIIGTAPLLITQNETHSSLHCQGNSSDVNHHEKILPQAEENIRSVHAYVTVVKEKIAKLQYQKQLLASRVLELERNGSFEDESVNLDTFALSPANWKSDFHLKQKEIFELWDACHVSIIHRSQFYLLFRGDPADAIYIEVELRSLTWLRNYHLKSSRKTGRDNRIASPGVSIRNLKRERELIVKNLKSGLTAAQRDTIYKQWGIPVDAKERKIQLANLIWTNPQNEEHIKMSADLVARLFGLWSTNHGSASKEMFQLSFSPPSLEKSWFDGWTSVAHLFGSQ